ncbi:hypothetical protein JCM3774_006549 [Rhodotorula dairenensis]
MERDNFQDPVEAEQHAEEERELLLEAVQELGTVLDELELWFGTEQPEKKAPPAWDHSKRHSREGADMLRTALYELSTYQTYQVSLMDLLDNLSDQVTRLKKSTSRAHYRRLRRVIRQLRALKARRARYLANLNESR